MQENNELELDKLAYSFIPLITVYKLSQSNQDLTGSASQLHFKDLTDYLVDKPSIAREPSHDSNRSKIYVEYDNQYGFSDETYPSLFLMFDKINQLDYFKNTVTLEYIEENAMFWYYDVFKKSMASVSLITYLKIKAEECVEERVYYFPILNLHIHDTIRIGDVSLTFFTAEYFDNLQQKLITMEKDVFDKLYRKFQGEVFASYSILAEEQKGTAIAFEKCAMAVDVLKLFSPTVFFPDKKCHIGLSEKININFQSDHISVPKKDLYTMRVNSTAKNDPFTIDKAIYDNVISFRLDIFSKQLVKVPSDELSDLILQSIQLFSYALSTFDLHLRVTHIITIFESLLLEEERQYKMKEHVSKRLLKLFNDVNIPILLNSIYTIRHKMIHKAIKLDINISDLQKIQMLMVNTLMRLCMLNQSFKTKKEFIDSLGQ